MKIVKISAAGTNQCFMLNMLFSSSLIAVSRSSLDKAFISNQKADPGQACETSTSLLEVQPHT